MPKLPILFATALAVTAGVGIVLWLTVLSGPNVRSVTADGIEVRYSSDTFPGSEPALAHSPADEFVDAFGLPATEGGQPIISTVTTPGQSAAEFEVRVGVAASIPAEATPAIFTRDADTNLWLPLPTTVDATGLVATTTTGGEFTAALTTATAEPWRGTQWLGFQVTDGPSAPACDTKPPIWLIDVAADGAPAVACAESGDAGELVVRVGVDRRYPLAVSAPGDAAELATTALGASFTWAAGELPDGDVKLAVTPTAETARADLILALSAALDALDVVDPDPLDNATADALDCALTAGDPDHCLVPFDEAVDDPAANRMITAVRTTWTLSTGANTAEGAAALQDAGSITLTLASVLDPPPDGATLLSDVLTGLAVGPSGNPVSVLIGETYAEQSSTQWVGCEGQPAIAEFALGRHTRFTGLLGARDYMPEEIVAGVTVLSDGDVVAELTVGTEPVPVDIEFPPGDVLRIEAIVLDGECGPAPDGYLVWGNGALSG